jgi:hypothetical protein
LKGKKWGKSTRKKKSLPKKYFPGELFGNALTFCSRVFELPSATVAPKQKTPRPSPVLPRIQLCIVDRALRISTCHNQKTQNTTKTCLRSKSSTCTGKKMREKNDLDCFLAAHVDGLGGVFDMLGNATNKKTRWAGPLNGLSTCLWAYGFVFFTASCWCLVELRG